MTNSLNSLKQHLNIINRKIDGGKITCNEDVMNVLKEVDEKQTDLQNMLQEMKEKYEEKQKEVKKLQVDFQNLKRNAEAKVRRRGVIENCAIFVISWWWVYLAAQKYMLPYFYSS